MARELTLKQKGFIRDYIRLKNGTQAVRNNYDVVDESTTRSIASENLTKPHIRDEIELMMKEIDATEKIKKVINSNIQANKTTEYKGKIISSNKPDYAERRKTAKFLSELGGYLAPKQIQQQSVSLSIVRKLEGLTSNQLSVLLKEELEKLETS